MYIRIISMEVQLFLALAIILQIMVWKICKICNVFFVLFALFSKWLRSNANSTKNTLQILQIFQTIICKICNLQNLQNNKRYPPAEIAVIVLFLSSTKSQSYNRIGLILY